MYSNPPQMSSAMMMGAPFGQQTMGGFGQMAPPPPAPRHSQDDEGSDDEGMARGGKRMRFAKKDLSIQIPDAKKVRLPRDVFSLCPALSETDSLNAAIDRFLYFALTNSQNLASARLTVV
jgi:hypothetical protein